MAFGDVRDSSDFKSMGFGALPIDRYERKDFDCCPKYCRKACKVDVRLPLNGLAPFAKSRDCELFVWIRHFQSPDIRVQEALKSVELHLLIDRRKEEELRANIEDITMRPV